MGEETSAIRQGIEETRLRVGEEVEALSYKTDLGARVDDYVEEKKQAVTSKVSGAASAVTSAVDKAMPGSGPPSQRVRSLSRVAEENPLGLAIGGAAVGFVAGLLLPSTRLEDERLGAIALPDLRDRGFEMSEAHIYFRGMCPECRHTPATIRGDRDATSAEHARAVAGGTRRTSFRKKRGHRSMRGPTVGVIRCTS